MNAPQPPRPLTQRILSSSLFHFLLVGGVCFALAPGSTSSQEIIITANRLAAEREAQRERLGQTRLTTQQRLEVDRRVIHDALLYQEARRLGLGHGDAIVQQRLVQKMLFLATSMDDGRPGETTRSPSEQTLRKWYQQHKEQWSAPAQIRLMHIYFRTQAPTRIAKIKAQAIALAHKQPGKLPALGDAFPLPRQLPLLPITSLQSRFGPSFANALLRYPVQQWSGPVASRLGWHLVWLHQSLPAQPKTYEQAKEEVRFHWIVESKQRARARLLRRLYQRYQLRVEGYKTPPFRPLLTP